MEKNLQDKMETCANLEVGNLPFQTTYLFWQTHFTEPCSQHVSYNHLLDPFFSYSMYGLSHIQQRLEVLRSNGEDIVLVRVYVKGVKIATGRGYTKEDGQENAARHAIEYLKDNAIKLKLTSLA